MFFLHARVRVVVVCFFFGLVAASPHNIRTKMHARRSYNERAAGVQGVSTELGYSNRVRVCSYVRARAHCNLLYELCATHAIQKTFYTLEYYTQTLVRAR